MSFVETLFEAGSCQKPNPAKEEQLSKVKTLRICHSPDAANPGYIDVLLVDEAWDACGTLRYPHDPSRNLAQQVHRLTQDTQDFRNIAAWLHMIKKAGYKIFPALERVALIGREDDAISLHAVQLPRGFAEALVTLPSVKYYCQSSILGPLALTYELIKPLSPPKIVTLHIAQGMLFDGWGGALPLVIGATNRYIVSCPVKPTGHQASTPSNVNNQWMAMLSTSVIAMLKRTHVQKEDTNDGQWQKVSLDSVSLDDTRIEWYNLIGDLILPTAPIPGQPRPKIEKEIKPLDMSVRQALARLVDTRIGPWKGKVSFHNLDEIPLCPACQVPDTTKPALTGITPI